MMAAFIRSRTRSIGMDWARPVYADELASIDYVHFSSRRRPCLGQRPVRRLLPMKRPASLAPAITQTLGHAHEVVHTLRGRMKCGTLSSRPAALDRSAQHALLKRKRVPISLHPFICHKSRFSRFTAESIYFLAGR